MDAEPWPYTADPSAQRPPPGRLQAQCFGKYREFGSRGPVELGPEVNPETPKP